MSFRFVVQRPGMRRLLLLGGLMLVGTTCRDRSLTGPGVAQRASLAIAPSFAAIPDGGPTIQLARVEAWLVPLSGVGDSVRVSATFQGDSAVLNFEVLLTLPSQQFILRVTGFGAGNVPLFRATDTLTVTSGSNPPVTGIVMQYAGPDAGVTDIAVVPAAVALNTGDTLTLGVTALQGDAVFPGAVLVGWTSRDPLAASVSPTGKVTGGGIQRAPVWIVARTATNIADSALVTVRAAVASLTLDRDNVAMARGDTVRLFATPRDAGGNPLAGRLVTWTTTNAAVASVDPLGLVLAVTGAGTASIIATSEGRSDTAVVTTGPRPVGAVTIAPRDVSLILGGFVALTATVTDAQGLPNPDFAATFVSRSPGIAAVSATGLVTTLAVGTSYVIATAGGVSDSILVTVTPVPPLPVASVVITPSADTLAVGDTATFSAATFDGSGLPLTGRSVTWSTLDGGIASVSPSGFVTARSAGSTGIVATSEGRADTALVLVFVPIIPVASVVISPSGDTLAIGDTATFRAATLDASGLPLTGRSVTWTTLDAGIASVSPTGFVMGLAPGVARIVATSEGQADTAQVLVFAPIIPVASVVITPSGDTLAVGDTATFVAATFDAQGTPLTGRSVTWSTLDGGIASVSATGFVTGIAAGTTGIVATSEGRADTAQVLVFVPIIPVARVVITPNADTLVVGDTATFTAATLDAGGAPLSGRSVIWTSLDTAVAVVTPAGLVRGLSAGTTGIVATSEGRADTANVLVVPAGPPPITSTTIAPRADTLISLGDTATFRATSSASGQPATGTYTWVSRNEAIASVSASGLVTSVGNGSTYIVVTEAGGTRDSAQVLVQQRVSSVSVTPSTVTRYLGTRQLFTATAVDGRGIPMASASFTWSSSVPTVASVDTTGNVSMLALGTTAIRATAGGVTGQAALTVVTAITRIAVTPDSVVLTALGMTQAYRATAYDTLGAPMTGVTFSLISSNPSVASISSSTDSTTVATAGANGSTFIRASAQGVTGSAFLTVRQVVAAIDLTPLGGTISPTGRIVLTARGRDANGNYISLSPAAFTWISDAPTLATVADGVVTATGAGTGTANITARLTADSRFVSNPSVITISNTGVGNRIFFGRDTLTIGRASSNSIPLYLSDTRTFPIVVTLVARDTVAYFPQSVDTIPAGANTINVQLNGRNAGVTELYVSASAGYSGDTAIVLVQANVRFAGGNYSMIANDQRNDQILLSDPAPAGGVYVTYNATTPNIVQISPDPAFIPAGQLAANVVVRGVTAGTTTVSPNAAGVNGQSSTYTISAARLTLSAARVYVGAGQYRTNAAYVYTAQNLSTALAVALGSSDTTIGRTAPSSVTIPSGSYYAYFTLRGLQTGLTSVTATAPGWTPAALDFIVTSPVLDLSGGGALTTTSPTQRIDVYTGDTLGSINARINSLVVSVSSSDPTVLQLLDTTVIIGSNASSAPIRFNAIGGGTAYIRVSAGGHRSDSVAYTVSAPKLNFSASSVVIGSEQRRASAVYVYTPNNVTAPLVVTLTPSDSTVAATAPTVIVPTSSYYAYLELRGHRTGTATFIATAPGYSPDTVTLFVSSPVLSVCCSNAAFRLLQPDATLSVTTLDTVGTANLSIGAVRVSLVSTNPTVASVDSAGVTIAAGTSSNTQARIRAVSAGTASIIVTATGHRPDTVTYTVVAPKLNFSAASHVIGRRQSQTNLGYASTPDNVTDTIVVRFQNSRPDLVQFPDSVVIPRGTYYAYYAAGGLATGSATIIATATGYMPDTLTVYVSSTMLVGANLPGNVATTALPTTLSAYVRDSVGTQHAMLDRVTIRVLSTDTNVVQLDSQYVHILAGQASSSTLRARYVGPGTARVIYSDSSGVISPDTTNTVTVTGPALRMSTALSYVGTRQRLDGPYVYVDNNVIGQPLVVRLASSAPNIVTVPDSVVIPVGTYYAYFTASALDTIARIRINLTATGYQPTFTEIEVGRPQFSISTATSATTTSPPQILSVTALDHRGSARVVTRDVVVRLTSTNAAVASPDSSSITIVAGTSASSAARMRYTAVGTTSLIASDPRDTVLYSYVPDTAVISVALPAVATQGMPASLGIGQVARPYASIPNNTTTGLTVSFSHNAALTSLPPSVVIPVGSYYAYFDISGTASGTDTVTTSAPGHVAETRTVVVGPGIITIGGWPSSMRIGDSVAVRIVTDDPSGTARTVLAQETFTLGASSQLAIVSGGANSVAISSITVAAGRSDSNYFYVKAVTAGTGNLTATNAGRYQATTKPVVVQ